MNTKKKTIYYDGSCAACSNIMLRINRSKKSDVFEKVDLVSGKPPQGFTKEELLQEIHVVDGKGILHRNFDAILNIGEEYPSFTPLVAIGRLPGFYHLGVIGYKLFAANRHLVFGNVSRVFYTKIVVSLGFFASALITNKLWMTGRSFPLIPVISNTPSIPAFLDSYIVAALLLMLAGIILLSNPRKIIFLFSAFFFLLVFFDINRLQIFYYQYFFMLLTLGFFSWNYKDKSKANTILNICRLIIVCIYFWGGLQKLNLFFVLYSFPWVVEPISSVFPASFSYFINLSGILLPYFESGIGIGLLFKKTRIFAICGALIMHLLILFTLGPLGHNWAPSIWPWNIVMILLVFILFWKEQTSARDILWIKNFIWQKIVLILFGIMPFFSFFNAWDTYLSFSMYAGNTNQAILVFNDKSAKELPSTVRKHAIAKNNEIVTLDISSWAYDEFAVLPYPETRAYKLVGKYVCNYITDKKSANLMLSGKQTLFNADKPSSYTCAEL